ncbi:hypothetical protein NKDENANG_00479 [Candidatus Entotheonellaceae bacterium PAL068K]
MTAGGHEIEIVSGGGSDRGPDGLHAGIGDGTGR